MTIPVSLTKAVACAGRRVGQSPDHILDVRGLMFGLLELDGSGSGTHCWNAVRGGGCG